LEKEKNKTCKCACINVCKTIDLVVCYNDGNICINDNPESQRVVKFYIELLYGCYILLRHAKIKKSFHMYNLNQTFIF